MPVMNGDLGRAILSIAPCGMPQPPSERQSMQRCKPPFDCFARYGEHLERIVTFAKRAGQRHGADHFRHSRSRERFGPLRFVTRCAQSSYERSPHSADSDLKPRLCSRRHPRHFARQPRQGATAVVAAHGAFRQIPSSQRYRARYYYADARRATIYCQDRA